MQLDDFYDQHVEKIYKFFYIKCLDRTTAEDLTSDTFVAFMEKIEGIHINDYQKYLYGIMRNTWLHFLREKYRQALVAVENIEDFDSHVQEHVMQFDDASTVENRLLPYVQQLPDKQRQVITLRCIDGLSTAETAQRLGKDRNYVKTTYKCGLSRLRTLLTNPYMEGGIV